MTGNVLEYAALIAAVAGFVGVVAEILTKDPAVLRALLADSAALARAPLGRFAAKPLGAEPANANAPAGETRNAA